MGRRNRRPWAVPPIWRPRARNSSRVSSASAEFFFECTYVRPDMPSFEQVQTAFGDSPRGNLRRATDPLYYETRQGGVERKLQIRLWANDALRSFSLSATRP